MPVVLVTPEKFLNTHGPHDEMLTEAGFEIRGPKNPQFARGLNSDAETIAEFAGVAAVIAGGENFSSNVLDGCPELRVIARCGVGYDRVDVDAATARNVAVTITPTANHECVAEHALGLMFGVAKNVATNHEMVRSGRWQPRLTDPIRGMTIGIVGLGRIGRSMAKRCLALGMTVIATEKFPDREFIEAHGIELIELDDLLARSDYLTVHCPLNDETRGLFNRDAFSRMKSSAVFINTARGGIVVESDLIDALNSGQLKAAGLDVFEDEPPPADNPLFSMENVVLSPHIGGGDTLSMRDMGIEAADCIIKLSRNEWPGLAVVNQSLRETWRW